MDKPTEYFDSTRKPYKKISSGDFSQMAYLTENLTKLNKSKKRSKKRARDSSDSDLDSDHKKYTVEPESGPSR